ncbi:MAG: thioredoxin family protein [Thermoproteota archaeon]
MIEVSTEEQLNELIRSSKVALILLYNSRDPQSRYVASIVEDIARLVEPAISTAVVDEADQPGIVQKYARTVPRLLLFIDGEKVWEQIGFFYTPSHDKYAIRRGILRALKSRGLTPSALSIRLR